MSERIKIMVRTRMRLRMDAMLIAISPEPIGRGIKSEELVVVILARDTPPGLDLQLYQLLSKYSKAYGSMARKSNSLPQKIIKGRFQNEESESCHCCTQYPYQISSKYREGYEFGVISAQECVYWTDGRTMPVCLLYSPKLFGRG